MTHWAFFDFLGAYSGGFYVAEIAYVKVTFGATESSCMTSASITLPKHAKITQLKQSNKDQESRI